jgi:hypothetical protein
MVRPLAWQSCGSSARAGMSDAHQPGENRVNSLSAQKITHSHKSPKPKKQNKKQKQPKQNRELGSRKEGSCEPTGTNEGNAQSAFNNIALRNRDKKKKKKKRPFNTKPKNKPTTTVEKKIQEWFG